MKPEEMRIKIAEACGWRELRILDDGKAYGFHPTEATGFRRVPDYLNDLNDLHEAEKVLNDDEDMYLWNLLHVGALKPWKATAAQRAEAFLKTLGLWKEEAPPQL